MAKISVKAIIIKEDRILLLKPKNLQGSFKGWDGPGGHVEEGESILDSLKREVLEETGLEVEKAYPIKLLNFPGVSTDYLIFLCPISSGEVVLSDEHTDYQWLEITAFRSFLGESLADDLREAKKIIDRLV